jgi:septal ring factor EnvC (AmiA/AmiB activator)
MDTTLKVEDLHKRFGAAEVLKGVSLSAKTGDVIASAGNSGGNEQSGLYFEIRHQGRAFDPLGWVTTR